MGQQSLALPVLLGLLGCVESPSLGPPPENHTSPILTVGGDEQGDQSGDGNDTNADSSDFLGCDPFTDDPSDECGVGMACDPSSLICEEALGDLPVDEVCDVEGVGDLCLPGLTCIEGRCREICNPAGNLADPDAEGSCPSADVCVLVESNWGVCLSTCTLTLQDCEAEGEACNRAQGAEGQVAACTSNPGSGGDAEPCARDSDCLAGLICTDQALHSTECASMAASCCTYVCDAGELPCVGIEPTCYAIGLPDQEGAGYCGAS
ncbi:hypothetical protein ACNOYE_01555 [Nannocystaceae bacterium ST9]